VINKIGERIKKSRNQKGFTLVELMVVVAIIGILSAIAVPVYRNVTQNAERSAVEANLRTIDGAIMMYQANNSGADPEDINALAPDYIQAVPVGPKGATYTIGKVKVNGVNGATRGLVKGEVGGKNFDEGTPLSADMWE
jgi:prepilin-type N-terminal cleavage/methylation domain-containing protein